MAKTKSIQMTSKAALALALLEGRVLNVKNCFKEIGLTNIAREIPRLIEKPFGVEVSRTPRTGKNKYDEPVVWVDYRLNKSLHNKEGIEKMRDYVKSQLPAISACKTTTQLKQVSQQRLLLDTI